MRFFCHVSVGKSCNLNCIKVIVIIVKFCFVLFYSSDMRRVGKKQGSIKGLQNIRILAGLRELKPIQRSAFLQIYL